MMTTQSIDNRLAEMLHARACRARAVADLLVEAVDRVGDPEWDTLSALAHERANDLRRAARVFDVALGRAVGDDASASPNPGRRTLSLVA